MKGVKRKQAQVALSALGMGTAKRVKRRRGEAPADGEEARSGPAACNARRCRLSV